MIMQARMAASPAISRASRRARRRLERWRPLSGLDRRRGDIGCATGRLTNEGAMGCNRHVMSHFEGWAGSAP